MSLKPGSRHTHRISKKNSQHLVRHFFTAKPTLYFFRIPSKIKKRIYRPRIKEEVKSPPHCWN